MEELDQDDMLLIIASQFEALHAAVAALQPEALAAAALRRSGALGMRQYAAGQCAATPRLLSLASAKEANARLEAFS